MRSDHAALEEVVEAANAVPAIAIGFEQQGVTALCVGVAVIVGEQVDELAAGSIACHDEADFAGFAAEVVNADHRVVAPGVADGQDVVAAGGQEGEVAPANLRYFLSHADDALHPVE